MKAPPNPDNELQRLDALYQCLILDTAPDERFDRITRLCQTLLECPICVVSLVDAERQWFKSIYGLDARETSRTISFCGHAILCDGIMEVSDARQDDRFFDNPLVAGFPNIVFYAGAPVTTARGYAVGTLCVIDHKPRRLDAEQRRILLDLSHWVADLIQLGSTLRDSRTLVDDVIQAKELEKIKDELIAVVSHELRTPLTSVIGALGLIKRQLQKEGATGRYGELFEIAYSNSFRLNMLVNDLLDIEKLMAGKMAFRIEPLALADLLQQAVQENKSYADQYAVRLQLSPLTEDFWVAVDRLRFQQVLSNLISNAVKFSPKAATVEITATRQQDSVRIAVRDHGPGIPQEYQSRIFQKFSQADTSASRKKEGTGLGLAISRELVERMDGAIGFESELGRGTTFFINFPLHGDGKVNAEVPL